METGLLLKYRFKTNATLLHGGALHAKNVPPPERTGEPTDGKIKAEIHRL